MPLLVAPQIDVGMVYVFALSSIAVYGVISGRLGQQQQVQLPRRPAFQCPDDLLRVALGVGDSGRRAGHRLARAWMRSFTHRPRMAGSPVCSRWALSCFVVAAFAEAGRLPFDLPECEQELVGGYHTEYSGMKLVLFLTAEFIHMITAAFLIAILFLGGWHFPGITGWTADGGLTWLGQAFLRVAGLAAAKIVLVIILFFMLVRWSWPRFRFDQLMALAWKVMLPLGVA